MKITKCLLCLLLAAVMCVSCMSALAYEVDYSTKVENPLLEKPVDEKYILRHGSIVFEGEDIIFEGSGVTATADANASGGMAACLPNIKWNAEDSPYDDLYAQVFLPEDEEEGRYKIWINARTTTQETASFFWDLNKGTYAAFWFSGIMDGKYRWTSADINLHHGENYIAIKRRGSGFADKLIITSNLNFKPKTKDDEPVYQTKEEQETTWLSYWDAPQLKPIEGHPRLYLTKDYIPTFRENLKDGELAGYYERFKKYAYDELDCRLDTTKANNHNAMLLTKIMARALVWVLGDETDVSHAKQTIKHMEDYIETVRTPDDAGDITRSRGNILLTAAIVYDWCYDAMTDADKQKFLDGIMLIAQTKEIGWPPTKLESMASHGGEQEIFRDFLGTGIAIYDEYPIMYEVAAGRMFEEMVPARLWLRQAGRFDQGNDYGECRYYSEVWADITMQRMGYPSIYGDIGSSTVRSLLRQRMSYGSMIPSGDMYSLTRTVSQTYYPNYPLTLCIAGNLYKDPYVKGEFARRQQVATNIGEYEKFFVLLFTDPSVETKIWDDWALAKYSTYPLSGIMARTSWQEGYNADNAMAFMNMHEAFINDHQNIYAGDFQLYYKGLLAMNTGTYNASTEHNEGYKRRAIAGNTMLCYDPDEKFYPTWSTVTVPNDGGQRTPYVDEEGVSKGSTVNTLDEYELDENGRVTNEDLIITKDVKEYIGPNEQTPEFSYITGDLTNAYSDKITDYHRSMVFMDLFNDEYPAALVVFDKMSSSKAQFKKTWLLHSEEKPQIDGSTTTITRTGDGFDGKLVNKTLIPARGNMQTTVVGNEGNEMFTIGGVTLTPKADTVEGGKYRIEISPKIETKDDVFLNAMYVTSASGNLPELPMYKEQGAGYVGVTVRDRMVTFSKDAVTLSNSFMLSVRNNGYDTVSILLSDMESGMWNIKGNGININVKAEDGKNCLYFKAAPGMYNISKTEQNAQETQFTTEAAEKRAIGDYMIWRAADSSASIGNGNFIYLEKPTKLINGTAYVAVETLKEFGAKIETDGSTAAILSDESEYLITAGNANCTVNGEVHTLAAAPFADNGTVYVGVREFANALGYSVSYRDRAKVIFAKKES